MDNIDELREKTNYKIDKIKILTGAVTDKGKVRSINEDNIYLSEYNKETGIGFCIVADGMGGHNAGEIASKMAIDEIKEYIKKESKKEMSDKYIHDILCKSMEKANTLIYKKSLTDKKYSGMGTTTVICYIYKTYIYIANVGDSRTYIIRNQKIKQITKDHSMIEELLESGTITGEEAKTHPQKHIITRALGSEEYTEIDIYTKEWLNDDIILICTDGLTTMLTDIEILQAINTSKSNLQKTAEILVKYANDKGGLDNITVALLAFKI